MKDPIERQAAIDALDKRFDNVPMEQTAEILKLRKDLRELPSIQPKTNCSEIPNNSDCISRQAAITAIQKAYADTEGGADKCAVWKNVGLTNALHIMQDLPSARSASYRQVTGKLDCISRQAAIDLLKQMRKDGDMIPWEGKDVFARIRKLPSAQPYTDEEVQKMQDVEQAQIEKAFDLGREDAKAEIIACGDCEHWICHDRRCGYWNHGVKPLDWCCHAERRTNDEQ